MVKRERSAGAKKATTKILVIQLIITLFAATVCFASTGTRDAYSAFVGGGISIIATLYFAQQVFSLGIGTPAAKIARRFYIGEAVKLVLTAVLFGIAILWLHVSFLPLFLTYIATLLAYWLALPFAFR
jgi:ATP synthase protein I